MKLLPDELPLHFAALHTTCKAFCELTAERAVCLRDIARRFVQLPARIPVRSQRDLAEHAEQKERSSETPKVCKLVLRWICILR